MTTESAPGIGTTSTAPQVSARTHASFNPLPLKEIGQLTNSAVTLTFDVPESLREAYRFTPGQHLTLRTTIDGAVLPDTPDRLFQDLVQETVMRMTSRVVLDPRQSSLDPGLKLTGTLSRFGYDTAEQMVVVRYDGALSTSGGTKVETRRFEARVPTISLRDADSYAEQLRDEGAVIASGFCGFMLGTTANAMANMEAIVERYGPAPRAFLVVPMVGAFFIDFTNALVITGFLNLLR